MKKFNKFKIWLGRKFIDCGFGILLKLDDRNWNPQKECYPGSVKQLKYVVGKWFVCNGIILESASLNKEGWPGYEEYKYFDKNFYLKKNPYRPHKNRKKNNGHDDFNSFFKNPE